MIRFPPLDSDENEESELVENGINTQSYHSTQQCATEMVSNNAPLPPTEGPFGLVGYLDKSKSQSAMLEENVQGNSTAFSKTNCFRNQVFPLGVLMNENEPIIIRRAKSVLHQSRNTKSATTLPSRRVQTAPGRQRDRNRIPENRERAWFKDYKTQRDFVTGVKKAVAECASNSVGIELKIRETYLKSIGQSGDYEKSDISATLRVYIEQIRKAVYPLSVGPAVDLALREIEKNLFSPNWRAPSGEDHQASDTESLAPVTYAAVVKVLEKRVSRESKENASLEQRLSTTEKENTVLKKQIEKLVQETERCHRAVKAKYKEIKQLETKVKHLNSSNSDYIDEFRDLDRRFNSQKELLREKSRENEQLLNKLMSTQATQASIEKDMLHRLQRIRDLEQQVAGIDKLHEELEKEKNLSKHVKQQHRITLLRDAPNCLSRVGSDTRLLRASEEENVKGGNKTEYVQRKRASLSDQVLRPRTSQGFRGVASPAGKQSQNVTQRQSIMHLRPKGVIPKRHDNMLNMEFGVQTVKNEIDENDDVAVSNESINGEAVISDDL